MEYYSAFLLQFNMEPCFSADTPPSSGIHIKQLSSHLYMALFPQIIITPLSGTYSFFIIPPLYDTISLLPFYILRGYYHTFICDFTAVSVPTFTWHFFTLSASILSHLNVTLPHDSPRSTSPHLNMVSFSLCFYHTFTWHWSFLSHLGSITLRSFSAAFPRRTYLLFHGYFTLHSFSAEGFSRSFSLSPGFYLSMVLYG